MEANVLANGKTSVFTTKTTTKKQQEIMGGNGSYSKEWGGVQEASRTHIDTGFRIGCHKVLVNRNNPWQASTPLNANSDSPIYLIAIADKRTGVLKIKYVSVNKHHKLVESIDFKYDKDGNMLPYNESKPEKGTHSHLWTETSGKIGRKSGDKNNHRKIPKQYMHLIKEINKFNEEKNVWNVDKN